MRSLRFVGIVLWLFAITLTFAQSRRRLSPEPSQSPLDHFVEDKDYTSLEQELLSTPLDSSSKLFFSGILDDRVGRVTEAINHLERVLPELRRTNQHRAALALFALSHDEFLSGRYAKSGKLLDELLNHYSSEFSKADLSTIRDNLAIYLLLGDAATQTVSGGSSFSVPTQRDAIGDLEIPIQAAGKTQWWIFDTGANITTISRNTANQLGLSVSKKMAQTQSGATGLEVPLATTIIPEIRLGAAVIRNVVALVMDDRELDVQLGENRHYAINGILGYPVLRALGSFAFSGMQIAVAPQAQSSSRSTRLYVEQLTLMVEAGVDNRPLLFQLDTGNTGVELTAKFRTSFPSAFAKLQSKSAHFGGAGQATEIAIFTLPTLTLQLGVASVKLSDVTVVGQPRNVEPLDDLYGNLGQGLLNKFVTYTIDLKNMRLMLGERAAN